MGSKGGIRASARTPCIAAVRAEVIALAMSSAPSKKPSMDMPIAAKKGLRLTKKKKKKTGAKVKINMQERETT